MITQEKVDIEVLDKTAFCYWLKRSMLTKDTTVTFWVILSFFHLCFARDSSGGCVYSFQVWSPNQDVLQRLQELEKR